ncbi:hypothetical protein Taro_027002 [Colocasia esculenta]|uniref:Uncharacterized protein n=1 Tax=Colocasia esculenta TaxID=4460 RepID=A0A843VT14_COLES|nr:hypothetical protein [Colocasia esculenta]
MGCTVTTSPENAAYQAVAFSGTVPEFEREKDRAWDCGPNIYGFHDGGCCVLAFGEASSQIGSVESEEGFGDSGNQTTQVDALSGQVDTRACSQNSSFQNWGQQVNATPEQVDTGSCSQNSCFQNWDSRSTQYQSTSTLDQFLEQPVSRFGTVCRHHHQGRSTHYGKFGT